MGMAVFGFLIGVLVVWLSKTPQKMINSLMRFLLVFSLYALVWIIYTRLQSGQAFHTEIFLIIPVFMYFF